MPASDKQLASTVKKVTSRELPKKGADIVNMSQGTSPLPKDKGTATEPGKTVGTKRSDAPSSPGYHNVYVRRKVENDHSKTNKPELPSSVAVQHDQTNKPELPSSVAVQHDQTNKPELPSSVAESGGIVFPNSPEKTNEQIVNKKNEPPVAPGTTVQDDTHKSSNQYWNARFNRLQTYLESCDRSTQEGYMRMLRSLSAADRSMHAIDLEKRAIHLLVEEGKELQRMKALNVLGKVSPNVPSKQAPL
uniref:Serine-rich 25 kDa antigen protein n=1 Tax=Oryza barthii TaxID=65489 RepID=A0A0D3FS83_9ORYZ